jgi:endogenous inhibitor of DNA gyrase (YacG/DUF329 family)
MTAPCPTCREPAARQQNRFFPFCSERCKWVDLGRWMAEDYRIPVAPEEDDDGPAAASSGTGDGGPAHERKAD